MRTPPDSLLRYFERGQEGFFPLLYLTLTVYVVPLPPRLQKRDVLYTHICTTVYVCVRDRTPHCPALEILANIHILMIGCVHLFFNVIYGSVSLGSLAIWYRFDTKLGVLE